MPIGNYSYPGQSESFAITEPGVAWSGSHGVIGQDEHAEARTISAKEPDRQSTARRGASRRRGGMGEDYDQDDQPRSRTQRAASSRRGAQARRGQSQSSRRGAAGESKSGRQKKSRRGFAAMSPEQQREIARKGGLTVSRNRRHMADIGRIGGEHSHGGRRARR